MNFLYPLGLLGLIGVPILIIIYIITNSYKEITISSTYIWELSEKYMKKKTPFSSNKGIISLIMQIICVIFISLSLSHPSITIKDGAKNYLFILDESASMNMVSKDKTRFDRAIEKISDMVSKSMGGSKFSLIEQKKEPQVTFSYMEDKDIFINYLNKLSPTTLYLEDEEVFNLAQTYFDNDPSLDAYYFTDKDYDNSLNIKVVDLKDNEYNAMINDCDYEVEDENILISGNLISFNEDKELDLSLIVDDEIVENLKIDAKKDQEMSFSFSLPLDNYAYFLVLINNEDALEYDNYHYMFGNDAKDSFKTLLISSNPFYLKNIISICGSKNIQVKNVYNGESGYDLYVFDSCNISSLPKDGAILFNNVSNNVPNSGIIVQDKAQIVGGAKLNLSNGNNSTYNELSSNLIGKDIYVSKYINYSLTKSFTSIYEYNGFPMIFAGTNYDNNKQVVFSFDLHDSNFPLNVDFVPLFKNLINYLVPTLIEKTNYISGEDLKINVLPNITSLRMNTSLNYSTYLPLQKDVILYPLDYIGIYSLDLINNVNQEKKYYIYVSYPKEESNPIVKLDNIYLLGNKKNQGFNSSYDILFITFILLIGFVVIEWGVYVYEEHYI